MSLLVQSERNPTCPKVGMRVKCIRPNDSMFGKVGMVEKALVNGHSWLVMFPLVYGKILVRFERDDLEVISNGSEILENLYRRYASIRIHSLIEALHIMIASASFADAIQLIAKEIGNSVDTAFSEEEAREFLQNNGLPDSKR